MKIKSIIFYALLCAGVYICAMNNRQSVWDVAWERELKERRQAGESLPEGLTYEEAIRMDLKNKIYNEQARGGDRRKQAENKTNEAEPK